jgi:hypothetical protein
MKHNRRVFIDKKYLYFTMTPYKKYTFGKFIEKLNNEKFFMLS